jgi:phenylacetate-CoA ligase
MSMLDVKRETMSRDQMSQVQIERLQALLARLKRNVRRYRELLGDARIDSLTDLPALPATSAEDLVAAFPYGMFALPLREVIRLHSVVGPAGRQLAIGHTRNDLVHWGRLAARQMAAAGVTAHDVILICFEAGVFKGATGYTLGAEVIEASVIPEDPFHVDYQLAMLQNYRATVLITSPTNARKLVDLLRNRRIDPQSLALRAVLLSRPVSAQEREDLRAGLFADVRCNFGVSEILDPGLCVECEAKRFHVNEDQFLVECEGGELLVTTLCREAMPLLRYRTQVACALRRERCPCGRTGVILEPGDRLDGRLRVNEMPLYPEQISDVLAHTRAVGHRFRTEISERGIVIYLGMTGALMGDTIRSLQGLEQIVKWEFHERLGIDAEVRYVEPRSLQE